MQFKKPLFAQAAFLSAITAGVLIAGSRYELRPAHAGIAQAAPTALAVPAAQVVPAQAARPPESQLYVQISEKLMPSVVNISTTKKIQRGPRLWRAPQGPGPGDDFWGQFFGGQDIQPQAHPKSAQAPMSLGTGFVVEVEPKGGLILTNFHVIDGADEVQVKFTESEDEAELPAQVIGKDPELDIALLRVRTDRKLTPAPLGDSDRLQVGEWIAALGNPFGHGHSITHGIVSAKERSLPGGFGRYLQVDAPINPGNSGGPLVNLQGEVVGVNNAIDARGPGIGFAIPSNSVKAVLAQLKQGKSVERGYLGVNIMPLKPELARALRSEAAPGTPVVAEVMPGTPAAKAGLEPYDVITELDGKKVRSGQDLVQAVMQAPVGQKMRAEIWRGGKRMSIEVPVAKRPEFNNRS